MTSTVVAATPSDVKQVFAVIVFVLSNNPAARWTYTDPHCFTTMEGQEEEEDSKGLIF